MTGTSTAGGEPTESSREMRGAGKPGREYIPELRTERRTSRLRRKDLRYTDQSMQVLAEAGIVRDL